MLHCHKSNLTKYLCSAVLLVTILCSCSANSSNNTVGTANSNTSPVTSVSDQTNENNAEIIAEIKQTLAEFKEFSYSYIQCKAYMFGENLDPNDTITVDGMVYYKAISGKYTSYSELMAEIDRYCSENVISECDLKSYSYCEGNNDSLYIWEDADSNGGVMGYDVAYITSIETLNDSSVKVNMTAWGDKDEWGYEDGDSIIPFEITMKSENGLWKIDKCGLMEMNYITWLFDADYSA